MTKDLIDTLRYAKAPSCVIHEVETYLNIAKEKLNENERELYGHSIIFAPICSKCGALITDTISIERDAIGAREHFSFEAINPGWCPNCKTYFNSIVAPGKLPFNVKLFFGQGEDDEQA